MYSVHHFVLSPLSSHFEKENLVVNTLAILPMEGTARDSFYI